MENLGLHTTVTSKDQLKHCESEDIAHPESIQSIGAVIVFDADTNQLKRWSQNAPELLGVNTFEINADIGVVVPVLAPLMEQLRRTIDTSIGQRYIGVVKANLTINEEVVETDLELLLHRPSSQPQLRIVECIPLWKQNHEAEEAEEAQDFVDLNHMLQAFRTVESSEDFEALIQNCVQGVQALTSYDRVMVYRFDQDWHGQIIGESVAEHLEPRFVGQHFPASDIPAQARELYKKNRLRIIADTQATPAALLPVKADIERTDLSDALLRCPSPFHITYLGNMGVRSTLTLSILVNGQLWGMLTCHDSRPKVPPSHLRNAILLMMEMMGSFISNRIEMMHRLESSQRKLDFIQRLKLLESNKVDHSDSTHEQVFNGTLGLLKQWFEASHITLFLNDYIIGDSLKDDEVTGYAQRYLSEATQPLFCHDITSLPWCSGLLNSHGIGGIVLFPFSKLPGCGVMLTRPAMQHTREWAGKPDLYNQYQLADGEVVLGARRSFAVWKEVIQNQSRPWPLESHDYLDGAAELIMNLFYRHLSTMAREQSRLLSRAADVLQDMVLITKADRDPITNRRPIIYANPALCKLTGYTIEELLGRSPDLFQGLGTDRAQIERMSKSISARTIVSETLLNYTKTGEPYYNEVKIAPVTDDKGNLTHFVSVQRDVTSQIALTNELKIKNKQFQDLADRLPGAVYIFELTPAHKYNFKFTSAGFTYLFGLQTSGQVDVKLVFDKIVDEDRKGVMESIEEGVNNLQPWNYSFRVRRSEGLELVRYLRTVSTPYVQEDSSILWYGAVYDETEARALNTKIAQNEQALSAILHTIPEVLVDLDGEQRIQRVYSNQKSLFGKPLKSFTGRFVAEVISSDASQRLFELQSLHQTGEVEFSVQVNGSQQYFLAKVAAKASTRNVVVGFVCSITDITERKNEYLKAEYVAQHDALTGLLNRNGLQQCMHQAAEEFQVESQLTALFIDLDGFKAINDVHGHGIGDAILGEVAQRLRSLLAPDTLMARIGGDEFLILLQSVNRHDNSSERANQLAESLRDRIAEPYHLDGLSYHVDCSIGIATTDEVPDFEADLMVCADIAMYSAKQDGGGKVKIFEKSMHTTTQYRHRLSQDLSLALKLGGSGLKLAYQPIINHNTLVGHEVLLRWHHEELGWVSPGEFIPIAEKSSLIIDIGNWVITQALAKLKEWSLNLETQDLILSINISALQIHQDDFVSHALDLIQKSEVRPHKLKMEVTETLAQQDLVQTIKKLQMLRSAGIQISLDDFGTGYSSLAHLQKLPLDEVKVDQKFVREMKHDCSAAAIVQMVFALAKTLKLRVVAEGVETEEELKMLQSIGYQYFQGYYFGRPQFDPML